MGTDRAAVLDDLRRLVAEKGAPLRDAPATTSTGLPDLDRLVGGWPRPGLVEIAGPVGSGRLGLVLPWMARESSAGRWVGVVDVLERLHPPGLPGVDWSRLLMVRPGGDRAAWAAEQMAASGALALTVLLDPVHLDRAAAIRLQRAVERGGSRLVVISEKPDPALPAGLRLELRGTGLEDGVMVRVTRHRSGRQGQEAVVRLQAGALPLGF